MNDSVDLIVGQCCEACGGDGENYCEYAHAMRTCPECMGMGVVDEDTYVLEEERKRELEEFAGDCIRNSGGDPNMPNTSIKQADCSNTSNTDDHRQKKGMR